MLALTSSQNLDSEGKKNARDNTAKLGEFVQSHSAEEIKTANSARQALNRLAKKPLPAGRKSPFVSKRLPVFEDERQPKIINAYAEYNKSRWATGDFAGMSVVEASRIVSKEWKALPSTEKTVGCPLCPLHQPLTDMISQKYAS